MFVSNKYNCLKFHNHAIMLKIQSPDEYCPNSQLLPPPPLALFHPWYPVTQTVQLEGQRCRPPPLPPPSLPPPHPVCPVNLGPAPEELLPLVLVCTSGSLYLPYGGTRRRNKQGQLARKAQTIASFPGFPTVQFLIACNMQNGGGIGVYSSRGLGGGEACTKFMMCGTTTQSRT